MVMENIIASIISAIVLGIIFFFTHLVNKIQNKYRIKEVQSFGGVSFFYPQKRVFIFYCYYYDIIELEYNKKYIKPRLFFKTYREAFDFLKDKI